MREALERIEREFDEALAAAAGDAAAVEVLRVRYLGRKGEVTALMKELSKLPKESRREAGQAINELKKTVTARLSEQADAAASAARAARTDSRCTHRTVGRSRSSSWP